MSYNGDWHLGHKDGKGKMSFSNNQYVQGAWFKKKTREGTYKWANGDVFKGSFYEGKLSGLG